MKDRRFALGTVIAIGLFFLLAFWKCTTMFVWSNEAWFASPAYTLVHQGYLGTTILESKGTWLEGSERRTYWMPPLYLLLQAGWYELFGFGLLRMRSISLLAGAVVLLAWFGIAWQISQSRVVALLTLALGVIDARLILFSALGRPDMVCAALGTLGLLVYLHFRKTSLRTAILVANGLAASSCLTHPCGLLYAGGLFLLAVYYDRTRIGAREIAFAGLPYVIGAGAWGIYILQAPSQFARQFVGNISGIAGEILPVSRWSEIASPLRALKREFSLRYGMAFGWWRGDLVDRMQLFVLAIYSIAIAVCILTPSIRKNAGYRILLLLGVFDFLVLAWGDGLKSSAYLVHTMPLCAALLAVCIVYSLSRLTARRRWVLVSVMLLFTVIQLQSTIRGLVRDRHREDYDAVVTFLRRSNAPPQQTIAAGAFAFAFGFDSGIIDDPRLGYYSGSRPQFIVVNSIYRDWFNRSAILQPQVHAYIAELLKRDYRGVFQNSNYTIYRRTY